MWIRRCLEWLGTLSTLQGLPSLAKTIYKWGWRVAVVAAGAYAFFADLPWALQAPLAAVIALSLTIALRLGIEIYARFAVQRTELPFAVSVPYVGRTRSSIQALVVVLNRNPGRRVSLDFRVCIVAPESSRRTWHRVRLGTLNPDVDGEGLEEGMVRVDVPEQPGEGKNWWYLRVTDRISGLSTPLISMPGTYPAGRWLTPRVSGPTITKNRDEPDPRVWWDDDFHLSSIKRKDG
jgi:hypothetical protein